MYFREFFGFLVKIKEQKHIQITTKVKYSQTIHSKQH
jgi:hypothetical protein